MDFPAGATGSDLSVSAPSATAGCHDAQEDALPLLLFEMFRKHSTSGGSAPSPAMTKGVAPILGPAKVEQVSFSCAEDSSCNVTTGGHEWHCEMVTHAACECLPADQQLREEVLQPERYGPCGEGKPSKCV